MISRFGDKADRVIRVDVRGFPVKLPCPLLVGKSEIVREVSLDIGDPTVEERIDSEPGSRLVSLVGGHNFTVDDDSRQFILGAELQPHLVASLDRLSVEFYQGSAEPQIHQQNLSFLLILLELGRSAADDPHAAATLLGLNRFQAYRLEFLEEPARTQTALAILKGNTGEETVRVLLLPLDFTTDRTPSPL